MARDLGGSVIASAVGIQLLLSALPALVRGQPVPSGAEFQVNAYTTLGQDYPAVAADGGGKFVVVWDSLYQDGSYSGVFAQRYDSTGAPAGSEFQTNTFTTGAQFGPAVAAAPAGNFVVAWSSYQDGGPAYLGSYGIFAQRYDSTGSPAGAEFQVNTFTTYLQLFPAVASDGAGNFVVVWQSFGFFGGTQDGSLAAILGQRYDSAGAPAGSEFLVNTYTTGAQIAPRVASDPAGNFVVVWQSPGQDGDGAGVFGQRYDSTGAALGTEFQVNTYTTASQTFAAVAADAAGAFMVVWMSSGGQDGAADGIFGQRYSSGGAPLGGELQVNSYTTSYQGFPDVAADAGGGFVVVWESYPAQDGSFIGVFGQRYTSTGAPDGGEFAVNTYTTSFQDSPRVAASPAGNLVVVWESFYQDGGGEGVFAQRYGVASTGTTTTTLPGFTITTKILLDKPTKLTKVLSKDTSIALPDPNNSPLDSDSSITFSTSDPNSDITFTLAKGTWKLLGKATAPTGYLSKGGGCKKALIKGGKLVKAICPDAGFPLPDDPNRDLNWRLDTPSATYCGSCGGTLKGNPAKLAKRKDCPAPASCP